jgi:GTP-binding protein Era
MTFRSGMVAVVGRPNVGKSTLVNALVGEKVAIVSDKPQTTRRDIHAVWNMPEAQVVFTDTPGFHKPRTLLGTRLNDLVADAVVGVDLILHVVDASAGVGRGDAYVFARQVATSGSPAICVVNKVDRLVHRDEVPQLAAAAALGGYEEVVPISARHGAGLETVRSLILERMPEGPPLYPEAMVTDQPVEFRVAELIREQALAVTRQEVPHSVAVVIDEIEEDGGLTRIHASLIVERDSQKGIVIGKGGQRLKQIGSQARQEIEAFLASRVYLGLFVKVTPAWREDARLLARMGLLGT